MPQRRSLTKPLAAVLLLLSLLGLASKAWATDIPIPSQAEWADAKKTVKLANGITLAYVEMGNTDGIPTLLIHGYTDNSRSWSLLAPYLKHRRLLAIDLRGHGKSDAPPCCYDYADFADDAAEFLDAMKVQQADVIGHSLGSMVAQLLAAQHPEKVRDLVLISSTTGFTGGPGTRLWDDVAKLTAPIDPDGQFMKDRYANPNPVDGDFLARERAEGAAVPLHVWKGTLWAMVVNDLTLIAPLVKAPILVLWGENDPILDLTHQERLEKAYPDAEFQIFQKGGHNMFWEFPDKAARVILAFIDAPDEEEPLPDFPDETSPEGRQL
jgi:pimeloyl-ACP methyl ester carboxylesterase